jgi:hypothetical protein
LALKLQRSEFEVSVTVLCTGVTMVFRRPRGEDESGITIVCVPGLRSSHGTVKGRRGWEKQTLEPEEGECLSEMI